MPTSWLPEDWRSATFAGRLASEAGPCVVLARNGVAFDISQLTPTVSHLIEAWGAGQRFEGGTSLGDLDTLGAHRAWAPDSAGIRTWLAPLDLQCIKAAGVTFAASMLERVIEERARGDAGAAHAIRENLTARIGGELGLVKPGSADAQKLKEALIADGLWSQYLEVAIGPDAEIFTKAPVLSAVGYGDWIGVRSDSAWNNPEPEIVLICDSSGRAIGASLGNDVNLRDIEGRSALLLGKAKDNNASCAIGPLVRLFDDGFSIDDVRTAEVTLEVEGEDNFRLEGRSSMRLISRDPLDLAAQCCGPHHAYPDGFALFLGTMFAPIADREAPGKGFTHKTGDVVRVSSASLGVLENKVTTCAEAPRWHFGVGALMRNLAERGLLAP